MMRPLDVLLCVLALSQLRCWGPCPELVDSAPPVVLAGVYTVTTWRGPSELNGAVLMVTESDLTIAYDEKGVVQSVRYQRAADR